MSNEPLISRFLIGSCSIATALIIASCDAPPGAGEEAANTNAHNMRLVGYHDLQARSAYQPVVHAYGERRILFVGQHAGEAMNPDTGVVEVNGMSILDVTDPSAPVLLRHVPPTGDQASGTQHVQVCDGSMLPNGDPDRVYLVRTNGLLSYEMFDVTDPAEPQFLRTIATTGVSARGESSRGNRETHKIQWECESGIGYFNGTAEGWRVTRLLQAFDLADPEQPRHIRDFGLVGWQPGAEGPLPANSISGLHQPFVVGNRMYLGYGSGNDGTLQILDRDKFLNGDPEADDPFAPTPENLLYPQIARLDMPAYWGVHTAKPIYGIEVPDYDDDAKDRVRDFLLIPSEAGGDARRCQSTRDVMFIVDITQEDKPFPVSTYQVSEEPGDFCNRGGRFGPHSVNDAYHPGFDKTLVVLSYFNAGIRAVDIRNPFRPVEVGYFIPEVTENTIESCVEIDGSEICDVVIQTNNVNIDDRGYIYAVDRSSTGLHIVELTGEAREIVGLD
ncbi:MAG: hypothetical protein O6700_08625 [Gammaproteobacteria bacterium]|nr:hypothetical protein [Gammaproteobacteria bacterium]